MPDFLLRDLPEDLVTKLKTRAERNGRSLQAEIRETLRDSARLPWDAWASQAEALRARTTAGATAHPAAELIAAGHAQRDSAIDHTPPAATAKGKRRR